MSNRLAYINDAFIKAEEAKLTIYDLAIQRGYGIFDYFKTINSKPVFLEEHLNRFYYSATQMHLSIQQSREELKNIINVLIKKNNIPNSGIRLTLTGGYSPDGYKVETPSLIITQHPLQLPSEDTFEKGIKLVTYEHQRQLPHIKTIDYLMAIWLQPLLKQKEADDILYHKNGFVSECPRSNFFIVTKDKEIITPSRNILNGITRMKLLQLPFFVVKEKEIMLNDIKSASEAFITSTTKGVLPVVQIDEVVINDRKPGAITRKLRQELYNLWS